MVINLSIKTDNQFPYFFTYLTYLIRLIYWFYYLTLYFYIFTYKSMHEGYQRGSNILSHHQNYVLKILQPSHAKGAIQLLSTVFFDSQPLAVAYYKAFPVGRNEGLEIFRRMWGCFIDQFIRNRLSVGCFDTLKNDELVGVSMVKDFHYQPQGFDQEYMSRPTNLSCVIKFEQNIIRTMHEKTQNKLSQNGSIIDIMAVAIKPEHSGKKLLGKMMEQNLLLGQKAGHAHAFCFSANFRTSFSLKRLGFVLIKEGCATTFEAYGVLPFEKIEKEQQYSKIWMKELSSQSKI